MTQDSTESRFHVSLNLLEDHRRLERLVGLIEAIARRIEPESKQDHDLAVRALDWLWVYSRCHHAKEEEHLFPVLSARNLPNSVKRLIEDHAHGEMGMAAMREALKAIDEGADRFRDAAASFCAIYRGHIDAENTFLIPAIEVQLAPEEDAAMIGGILALEVEVLGQGGFVAYGESLDALALEILGPTPGETP